MKTSNIQAITSVKEYKTAQGTKILYHNLILENGDKINIGKQKQQRVGWEMNYEIVGDNNGHEYAKAKAVQPMNKLSSKDQLILKQVAFKAAIELIKVDKAPMNELENLMNQFNILLNK